MTSTNKEMANGLWNRNSSRFSNHAFSLLTAVWISNGASLAQAPARRPDPAIVQHLSQLQATRVEFAVDLFLSALSAGSVPRSEEIDILTRLYGRADEAREMFPVMNAPARGADGLPWDGLVYSIHETYSDGLTIKLRLLTRLKQRAPQVAKQLFDSLPWPAPDANVSCEAMLVPYLGDFYDRAKTLATPSRILEHAVTSPQAVAGLAAFLANDPALSVAEFSQGALQIAGAFKSLNASPRVFATTELRLMLGDHLEKLLRRSEVPPGLRPLLVSSYRDYLERHLKAARCADSFNTKGEDMVLKSVVPRFNRLAGAVGVDLLREADLKAARLLPSAKPSQPARSYPEFAITLSLYKKRPDDQQRLALQSLIRTIATSELTADCDLCELLAREGALLTIAAQLGNDPVGESAMVTAIRLAANSPVQLSSPATWMLIAKQLVNFLHHPDAAVARLMSNLIGQSTDPDLFRYAESERLFRGGAAYVADAITKDRGLRPQY